MTSIGEGCGQVGDGKSKVEEAATVVATAKATFDELSGTLAQWNLEGQSAAMANVAQQLEQP